MESLLAGFEAMSVWEYVAALLSLVYVLLAMQQNVWCWPAAFVSTLIYTLLFWQGKLVMESVLNFYYLLMAVYGFYQWKYGAKSSENDKQVALKVSSWHLSTHIKIIVGASVLAIVLGYVTSQYFAAKFAYLDAFTTVFAVITTYLVTQKILENWLYWIVIDIASIYMYIQLGYFPTVVLFVLYTAIAVLGYRSWKTDYQLHRRSVYEV